jgi:hypothetical protein
MQIYSRPTHAPLHRQIRANEKVAHPRARRDRRWRASVRNDGARRRRRRCAGGGGGGGRKAGLPGSQSGSGTRAARNGGVPRLREWFGEHRFHPTHFIHPLASLWIYFPREIRKREMNFNFFSANLFFPSVKYLDNGSYN